jgi:hypothetical protein
MDRWMTMSLTNGTKAARGIRFFVASQPHYSLPRSWPKIILKVVSTKDLRIGLQKYIILNYEVQGTLHPHKCKYLSDLSLSNLRHPTLSTRRSQFYKLAIVIFRKFKGLRQ